MRKYSLHFLMESSFIIAGLILLSALIAPWLGPYTLFMGTQIMVCCILALSLDIIYGLGGLLSLAQGVFFGLGGYAAAIAIQNYNRTPIEALLLAIVIGATGALIIGSFAVRLGGPRFIVMTMIISLVIYFFAQSLRNITGGEDGIPLGRPVKLLFLGWQLSTSKPLDRYYIACGLAAVVYAFCRYLRRSSLGWAVIMAKDNPVRAELLGYNVYRLRLIAFIIAGSIAAVSGYLSCITCRHVSSLMFHWVVSANPLLWCLFGGIGTLVGSLIGASTLYLVEEIISSWIVYSEIVIGAGLVLVIIFLPQGLIGLLRFRK